MRRGDASPWAWVFWLVVLSALLTFAVSRVWLVHESTRQQLESLEPRYARMAGLDTERVRLQAVSTQASQALARHVYATGRDVSQAGNDAQQRVREVFSKAGLDVVSIQLLPAKPTPQFDRIPVTLRVEGEVTALQAALAALPTTLPTLFVEGFTMQSASGLKPDGPVRVVAQFDLFALRARR